MSNKIGPTGVIGSIGNFDEHQSFIEFCCLRLRKYNLAHRVS